jgi:hypothetical protein
MVGSLVMIEVLRLGRGLTGVPGWVNALALDSVVTVVAVVL